MVPDAHPAPELHRIGQVDSPEPVHPGERHVIGHGERGAQELGVHVHASVTQPVNRDRPEAGGGHVMIVRTKVFREQ
jgi:hypothetical protein